MNGNQGPASTNTQNITAQLQTPSTAGPVPATSVDFAQSGIPFILAPTGTIVGNVLTFGSTLPNTYPNAYVFLPAGAVYIGSPPGWYFAQFISTTVGTVFGNTYVPYGMATIPTSLITGLAGTGAYTGVITPVIGPQIIILGGTMGPNGVLRLWFNFGMNGNTDAKVMQVQFGGVNVIGHAEATATTLSYVAVTEVINCGVPTVQVVQSQGLVGANTSATKIFGVNTAVNQVLAVSLQIPSAGDFLIMDSMTVEVMSG